MEGSYFKVGTNTQDLVEMDKCVVCVYVGGIIMVFE